MSRTDIPAPYGEGAFEPVSVETTAWRLDVEGTIPPELTGLYVRNGSNPPPGKVEGAYHWFLADGMVHGVRLHRGRAEWYRNRWVRTDVLAAKMPIAPAGGASEVGLAPNVANTSVVRHGGRILALCEVGLPYELDEGLETVGRYDFDGQLRTPMSAHPKIDPVTGEMIFLVGMLKRPHVRCHTVAADGTLVRTEGVDTTGPSLVHDMAITERYVVIPDQPVVFNLGSVGITDFPFAWDDHYQARIGLLSRDGQGDVRWFDVDPCFFIHTVNAFDDGESVVLDVARYPAGVFPRGNSDALNQGVRGTYHRFRLDLRTGQSTEETVSDRSFDLPSVAPTAVGRAYRYGYGTLVVHEGRRAAFSSLAKWDTRTGATEVHPTPGVFAESTVVPAADDPTGDAGWALSYRWDPTTGRSDLVIVDTTRFDRAPQAVIHLPQRVPLGFHGSWLPDAA